MVELVIVMTIMVIAVGVAAPSFKSFLQGQNLENEARRFLALTRFGSSRAVSEGIARGFGDQRQTKQILAGRRRRLYRNQDQRFLVYGGQQMCKSWSRSPTGR